MRIISKEEPFVSITGSFIIGKSSSGYTLQYSIDGEEWTPYTTPVPANETAICISCPSGLYLRLFGNTDEDVKVTI